MKSIDAGKIHLLRGATVQMPVQYRRFGGDLRKRAINAVMLAALVVTIVALCAAMFIAFHSWTHYAPLLPPDNGSAPPITQPLE